MIRRLSITVVILAAGLFVLVEAQQFRTGIEIVRVDALVMVDRKPVTGLTAEDFDVRDSGVAQAVSSLSFERLPLNIICVLDASSSVKGEPLRRLREGTTAIIDALGADDRAALIAFSSRLTVHTALTGDKQKLKSSLANVAAEGATSLLDATFAGLALRDVDPGRTLLLLFSDGIDTSSWLTARRVLDAARRSDVVIYPVSARSQPLVTVTTFQGARLAPARQNVNQEAETLLKALAEETGGRLFVVDRQTDLTQAFLDVVKEFRQRYVLTYTPTGVPAAGWHPLEVRVKNRNVQVTARRGYYASR
jgi:VWFA-related protein